MVGGRSGAEDFDDAFVVEAAAAAGHFGLDVRGVGFVGAVEEFEGGVTPDADLDGGFDVAEYAVGVFACLAQLFGAQDFEAEEFVDFAVDEGFDVLVVAGGGFFVSEEVHHVFF